MFWTKGGQLAYNSTSLLSLSIIFPIFFHNTLYAIWTTPSLNCGYPLMRVHTSHWPYGYPLFTLHSWQRMHLNSWCSSWHLCHHYTRCWFTCGMKKLHVLPSTRFNFSCSRVNVLFTKDGIRTLINVVIANPTWANSLHLFCTIQKFATSNVAQAKNKKLSQPTPN